MFIDAATELLGFLASFLAVGAAGFRYAISKRHDDETVWTAARRAAVLGFIGALVTLAFTALNARKHAVNQMALLQLGGWILAALAFALCAANKRALWPFAATGVIVGSLAPLFVGEFARAVNPIHRFAGGMWIGTLFVLVVVGLIDLVVDTFTPLALGSFAILGASGVWTAWKHLKRLDALWTTPYGYALIAKLCVVAIVLALGAFNWRRRAASLRRSATWELAAAGVVLVITAVLVSLPSPR
jgi:putative copper export protein